MKLFAYASLLVLLISHIDSVDAKSAREDLMEKIADVVAFARVCPALQMDTASISTIAMGQSIGKSDRDYDVIDAMADAREGTMRRDGDSWSTCETGRRQYGPGGSALPGMLRER